MTSNDDKNFYLNAYKEWDDLNRDKKEVCLTYFDERDPEKSKRLYKKVLAKIQNDK